MDREGSLAPDVLLRNVTFHGDGVICLIVIKLDMFRIRQGPVLSPSERGRLVTKNNILSYGWTRVSAVLAISSSVRRDWYAM